MVPVLTLIDDLVLAVKRSKGALHFSLKDTQNAAACGTVRRHYHQAPSAKND